MSDSTKKEIVIKMFDIQYGTARVEEEANKIVQEGYELFSSTMGGTTSEVMNRLVLIFKKKKE